MEEKADIVFVVGGSTKLSTDIQRAGISVWMKPYDLLANSINVHVVVNKGDKSKVVKAAGNGNAKFLQFLGALQVRHLCIMFI